MQCLYCGKGIGPIRQLRDLEFCSDAHRDQFRERYRQRLYEVLAPEPPPAPVLGFLGKTTVTVKKPALVVALEVLPRANRQEIKPALGVHAECLFLDRAAWACAQQPVAMPASAVWHASVAAAPPQREAVPFRSAVKPPVIATSGIAAARLAPLNPATSPRARAQYVPPSTGSPAHEAFLPDPVKAVPPAEAGASAPRFKAAAPASAEAAAIGHVRLAVRPPVAAAPGVTVASPAADLSPAIASKLSPRETGPLQIRRELAAAPHTAPVAFEAHTTREAGILLPAAPAAAAPAGLVAAGPAPAEIRRSQTVIQQPRPAAAPLPQPAALAPRARPADPLPAVLPAAVPTQQAARTADALAPAATQAPIAAPQLDCSPARIAAPAALLQSGDSCVSQAAGNVSPRPLPAPAFASKTAANPVPPPLDTASVPQATAEIPQPAAPPAAAPAWDASPAARTERAPIPLANITVPAIEWTPAPAGAIAGSTTGLPPAVGRDVRACAVLWTLRYAPLCSPGFSTEPVFERFNELLNAFRTVSYQGDEAAVRRQVKNNVRVIRRIPSEPSRKQKWHYIGAAAAALLLAGILSPQMVQKRITKSTSWGGISIKEWMTNRATRSFEDDFRTGLDQWGSSETHSPTSWAYNRDGFIHPAQLALFRPSMNLSDYRFEFMAQIENKSVDWVVRAHNKQNYYAVKFTVLQPGPRPLVAMVRYPVIEGAQGARVQTPLRMMIHANTPYRVTLDVKGNRYRTFIEDQEADNWTDDRLKTGGVGFFSEAGERARVYWVKLESHGDLLGRICGLLSGHDSDGPPADTKENQAWVIGPPRRLTMRLRA